MYFDLGGEYLKKLFRTDSSVAKSAFIFSLCACLLSLSVFVQSMSDHFAQSLENAHVTEASVFNSDGAYSSSDSTFYDSINKSRTVIPLGSSFGIKLFTDGVIVASLTDVEGGDTVSCPAYDAGIRAGDYILSANGTEVTTNSSLASLIGSSEGQPIALTVKRGDETFETTLTPVFCFDSFKAGMWVRDSAAGIGTLTFYDPETGMFAGLGHGICDMDTHGIMSMQSGEPAAITLCGIIRGAVGEPGQLQGYFTSDESMGQLIENNETGVYGILNDTPTGESMEIAERSEVKTGKAEILVTVDENGPKRYAVNIDQILSEDQKTKNMIVTVTDKELLELTGGIVQGMSGCPIIQNGKLVGAVTHVFTEDPKSGYGIFASTMLEESVVYSMSKQIET